MARNRAWNIRNTFRKNYPFPFFFQKKICCQGPCSSPSAFKWVGHGNGFTGSYVIAATTTGYFAVQMNGVTYQGGSGVPGTNFELVILHENSPREFCLYSTNASGSANGSITFIDLDGEGPEAIDPGVQLLMTGLSIGAFDSLASQPVTLVYVPENLPLVKEFGLYGSHITTVVLDQILIASAASVVLGGYISAVEPSDPAPSGTPEVLAAIATLTGNGWTVYVN